MAEFMFPNVAYRATVYRTGVSTNLLSFNKLKQSSAIPNAVLWLITFAMADESTFVRKVLIGSFRHQSWL